MSDIEYQYTGRLWVLPHSRQYELLLDNGRRVIGTIAKKYFTTKQLASLVPGGQYQCELDGEIILTRSASPKLLYIRSENGEPL